MGPVLLPFGSIVQGILELLAEGLTFSEIVHDYHPDITAEDIRACLQYAIVLVANQEIHLTKGN